MVTLKTTIISSQAGDIYQLLLKHHHLTARQIGKALGIYPHGVYRAAKHLQAKGLIAISSDYPAIFSAKHPEEAVNEYLHRTREQFLRSFDSDGTASFSATAAQKGLHISFIQDRQDLLNQSNEDMYQAKREVSMIVSGLVASAETILAYKRASERGVHIRIIVQRLDEANEEVLKNWKKLGVEVRYYPLIEARILLLDDRIAYITSYNPDKKEEGKGVKLNYMPITLLLKEIFEKRWELAKEL